jgi:SPP1 gp7 family putative phage head morphogenesis protein
MGNVPVKAIPKDHPHRRQFAQWEREVTDKIAQALARRRRDLFRGITRENVSQVLDRLADPAHRDKLRAAIYEALLPVARGGVDKQREVLEKEVLGVKGVTDFGFDWEMVHEVARQWLRNMTFDLIAGIERTTSAQLRRRISEFIADGEMTMGMLSDLLAPIFGPVRAEMIAVTEVTRTFAEAEIAAMRESGLVRRKKWQTANDELVCPICGPLNQQVVDLDENFPGGFEAPPAHPRCRCWISPVVEVPDVD